MPKVAIFFCLILLSSVYANSYAFTTGDNIDINSNQKLDFFDSGIVQIDDDFFSPNNFKRYIVFGTNSQEMESIKNNSLYGVNSDNGFFYVTLLEEKSIPNLISQGYQIIEDFPLEYHSTSADFQDASRIGEITGSDFAQTQYNMTGNGIKIAVVDTGVDFSNLDIQHSLARDEKNHPIMLDADGQGLILTNATFFAFIDNNEIIRNYSKPIPEEITSKTYVTKKGIFLDIFQEGKGTKIPIYNSFFPQFGTSIIFNGTLTEDIKIGNDNRNYIKSKSGIYHLGVIYQGALSGPLARVQVLPVLLVDANSPGVYDTIIPDLTTSWEDYTRFDLKNGEKPDYDFDFTDEKPIILGSGKEFLVYDSNKDGKIDYSAGTIGAQVLDVYGVIQNKTNIDESLKAINGTLLPAIDPDGEFFGVMSDFMGHGTSSAASISSQGQNTYDIYNDTKKYVIRGVAPDAKIIPVKALWFGDTVYAWLWSAGFENKENTWKFTGTPRADIISNSWGISNFPSFESGPGLDVLSMILSVLVTPHSLDDNYPGVTIVSSAGNSGHGYGTIGLPNVSPFGISVGATTNNVFVGYGPFKDQPRFGNSTSHYNHVVDFSSRGPGIIGDPKPDIMSIGAHGFVPANMIKTEKNSKEESFSLFGGTSMAAPLVSGSAAIVIEGLQKNSKNYDPFTIKNILMSTAKDLKNDPFTQGSGLVDVNSALNFVYGNNGTFIVHNDASYKNIKKILDPALKTINSTEIGFERFQLPSKSISMTSWFAGHLLPGERSTTTFTIENPNDISIKVNITPEELSLIKTVALNGTTIVRQQDLILNKSDAFIPNYIKLSDVKEAKDISELFDEPQSIPEESSLMIINANFPFSSFMNKTDDIYANDLKISSLYLYDWIDKNNDTKIVSDELSMISRAGSWGTVQELRISDPTEKFEGTPLVGVYPVPTRYSYWLGDTKLNSTSMDYTLSASHYQKEKWPIIWPDTNTITVPQKETAKVSVTLVAPDNLQTGVYQGFLNFESENHTVNVPVSYVIKQEINQKDSAVLVSGKQSDNVIFGNGYIKGAFDMVNRYMAGDWRQYYFDIKDETIDSASLELSWINSDTNLAVFVVDPRGKIIQTNMPSGVFGHFLGWPSLDWLGNSIFSQGGGFFPVKNKNETSTVLFVPINQTGTYSLLTHSTLFGGNSTTEPISITGKFTKLSSQEVLSQTDLTITESIINSNETRPDSLSITENKSESKFEPKPSLEFESDVVETQEVSSNNFELGILLGVGIGIAIGIIFIFIIRQKSTS